MKINLLKIALFVSFTILLTSCSTSVRFSSNKNKYNRNFTWTSDDKKSSAQNKAYNETYSDLIDREVQNTELNEAAEKWLGVPYKYGGIDESGVDCSAFTQNVYSDLGIHIPRTAAEQYDFTERINNEDRKPGDLIFFEKEGNISHVGLYLGNNEVMHASSSMGVTKQSLNSVSVGLKFAGFGRVKHYFVIK